MDSELIKWLSQMPNRYERAKEIVEKKVLQQIKTIKTSQKLNLVNFLPYLFPLLLCKMTNPNNPRNRYQLATRSNLNYVRFAMVLFIIGFVLSSVVDNNAFSKCMKIYNNSNICYKLN